MFHMHSKWGDVFFLHVYVELMLHILTLGHYYGLQQYIINSLQLKVQEPTGVTPAEFYNLAWIERIDSFPKSIVWLC